MSAATSVMPDELLRVTDLTVEFRSGRRVVHAVSGVSFGVRRGETLGLVGESGCGKSTTGRAILQLRRPTSGAVFFDGQDLTRLGHRDLRRVRTRLQMIFQDPISSLNPRRRVRDIVAEPLKVWGPPAGGSIPDAVAEALDAVGLDVAVVGERRPRQFSGGQCQRISIARALVLDPDLVICDEPVSAVDVSVQAQILNLLQDMKARYQLTLLFISHDLAVIRSISDRIAVMYLGKLCELGPTEKVYRHPLHPYTRALLDAVPVPDPDVRPAPYALVGDLPSPLDPPSGCRFRTRCPRAQPRCATEVPPMRELTTSHEVACHFPLGPAEPTTGPSPLAARLMTD